jgi:hypothetical protein
LSFLSRGPPQDSVEEPIGGPGALLLQTRGLPSGVHSGGRGRREGRRLPFFFKLRYIAFMRGPWGRGDPNGDESFFEEKETSGEERKGGKMRGKKELRLGILISAGFLLALLLPSCAEIPLNKISQPPPAAKLRVFVLPLTGSPPPTGWGLSHAEFARTQFQATRRILEGTGIYQIPTREDYLAVIGQRPISSTEWKKKDWALARRAGQALFADYVLIIERDHNAGIRFYQTALMNLETAKRFRVSFRVPLGREHLEEWEQIGRVAYAEIFREAKNDMLATAMRKGRMSAPGPPKEPEKPELSQPKVREVDLGEALKQPPGPARARLAVYDFDASEPLKIAALVLSEALREELFRQGNFTLVNRENMVQILNEMGTQQTGLVDEKQAVQAGKGLAASQIVLGQVGSFGNTLVLQVKRIDVESQATLSLGSVKCALGKEDELLAGLPELARKVAGKP